MVAQYAIKSLRRWLTFRRTRESESVKCRFSKCRFSAELEKLEKLSVMGGSVEKQIQKALHGPAFSFCRRAGRDAALAKADFFFAGAPAIENKIEQKI